MNSHECSAKIRLADIDDAEAIAALHVAAWQESYVGLVPDEMLAGLSLVGRTKLWRRMLSWTNLETNVAFIASTPAGEAVAFGSCGLQRSPELAAEGFEGEFQAIYVLRAAQRQGIGRGLVTAMARNLACRDLDGSALWVLRDNEPARRFYEVLGGALVGKREDKRSPGVVLHEVAYGWLSMASLITDRE